MLGRLFGFGRNEHYDEGIRLYDQGLYEEAIGQLRLAVQQSARPDALTQRLAAFYIAEAYANLGSTALQRHDYARAQGALAEALALNPHYADLNYHYGCACRKVGELDNAQAALENALQVNPRFAKAHFALGLLAYQRGQPDEALAHIQQAVALDQGYQTPALDEAIAAHHAGSDAAAMLFERISETDVDDIAYHAKLGTDLYRRGMYAQAAEEFRRALALNPGYADVRNHLAIALNALGAYADAVDEFRQALDINPRYVEARANLALTLLAAGQKDEAETEFRRVLELDPNNAAALAHLPPSPPQ